MPSPDVNKLAPISSDISVQQAEPIRSILCGLRTLHKLASTATAAPTNPYGVLDGTDAQANQCVVTAVPNGANNLVLFHDYRADNSALTTAPIIRIYGEVPAHSGSRLDGYHPSRLSKGPSPVTPVAGLDIPTCDWIPLAELSSGSLLVTVGSLTAQQVFTISGNDWYRSAPAYVALLGVSRVLVTISTASVSAGTFTTGGSAINGAFSY